MRVIELPFTHAKGSASSGAVRFPKGKLLAVAVIHPAVDSDSAHVFEYSIDGTTWDGMFALNLDTGATLRFSQLAAARMEDFTDYLSTYGGRYIRVVRASGTESAARSMYWRVVIDD